MLISFYLIGENVNSHKISAKIQKLNQNSKKEVVWVMKDNSFINLNYLLTIEKNNNDVLNTFHLNSTNNNTSYSTTFHYQMTSKCMLEIQKRRMGELIV